MFLVVGVGEMISWCLELYRTGSSSYFLYVGGAL